MVELEFKALNQREYRIAIVLIVLAILIPALLFMIFVVLNNLNKIPRSFLIGILGILGIISFFILALIVNKTLGKKYELTFNETELLIKSNKTEPGSISDGRDTANRLAGEFCDKKTQRVGGKDAVCVG